MKILSIVPSFKILGGVANHYCGLTPFWQNDVKYCFQGKRTQIPAAITLIPDFIRYFLYLVFWRPDVVIVNPSLRKYQLKRELIYIRLAKLCGIPYVTFIHGWDDKYYNKLKSSPKWVINSFGQSRFIYVLYSDFRDKLLKIGIKCPIILTTTKVHDHFLDTFDINCRKGEIKRLLFLARLEKSKGIFETLKIYQQLCELNPCKDFSLSVCGTGSAEAEVKEYISSENLQNVELNGNVSGQKLIEEFTNADVYILPTHGEGMATSVLEAMAFGLPILTSPIGGVNDFFIEGKMGYLIDHCDTNKYVEYIQQLIDNQSLTTNISTTNHAYAKNRFLASAVAKKFELDLDKYIF